MLTPSTRSPGERTLTTAASSPPEPAVVIMATSDVVPKNGCMPVRIRSSIAANSGPRWLIIWRAPASRTDGGRAVGPGMRRLGSKRSTSGLLGLDGRSDGRRRLPPPAWAPAGLRRYLAYALMPGRLTAGPGPTAGSTASLPGWGSAGNAVARYAARVRAVPPTTSKRRTFPRIMGDLAGPLPPDTTAPTGPDAP